MVELEREWLAPGKEEEPLVEAAGAGAEEAPTGGCGDGMGLPRL